MKLFFERIAPVLSGVLKAFYLYLGIVGLFSFSLFIMEEAIQMLSFANFSTTDTHQWGQTKANVEQIERVIGHMEAINSVFVALQPIQWWAYRDYINASKNYAESLHLEVLANEPSLYIGEKRLYRFYWNRATQRRSYWEVCNGMICYRSTERPSSKEIELAGVLERINDRKFLIKEIEKPCFSEVRMVR